MPSPAVVERVRRALPRAREHWTAFGLALVALAFTAVSTFRALQPVLADWSTWGGHDWDQVTAYRYMFVKSFREFGQFPFWNPYACGGHSAWAMVQGVSNLVSPFMPLYLLSDLRHAIRIELVGTVLIGLSGVWFWTGRFTRSAALRGFAAVCFVLNGRWAMQVATGHDWHWYYALTPWVFLCFDRALRAEDRKVRFTNVGFGAALVALLVYTCAIYPLPHTLFLLGCYALALAVLERSFGPLWILGGIVAFGVGLSAPKLVPALELMARFPRLVDSKEFVELRTLVAALTAPAQSAGRPAAPIPQWGWHEYGMYIGWIPFLALLLCVPQASGESARALRLSGVIGLLFGLGSFHPQAPWSLVHELPMFSSQHVPSRWLYPALLLFLVASVSVLERWLSRFARRRWLPELGLLLVFGYVAVDIGSESNHALAGALTSNMQKVPPAGEYFQTKRVPPELQYDRRGYAPEALPAMFANRGVIDCTMMPAQNVWAPKDETGRVKGIGARGRDESDYRGEAFIESGGGSVRITSWSPNTVEVSYTGATTPDLLVLNQNWDPGWRANGAPATNDSNRVAYPIQNASGQVRFDFRPRGLGLGIAIFVLTLGALGLLGAGRARLQRLWSRLRQRSGRTRSEPA